MYNPLTRRQMLRFAALGGFGSALAACASPTTPAPTAAPAAAAPTAPISAPTVAPAVVAPTVAPAVVTAAPTIAGPTAAQPTASPSAALTASMAQAATQLLGLLDGERRARASYAFADGERVRWHWTTPSGFPRNGLPLSEMAQPQRESALALLSAGHSPTGYQKAMAIMALQRELGSDPENYYVTIFGEPGGAAPWGWRWEGHHYSRHFTIVGDQVTMTPFFLGAWPTTTNAGLQAMPREENAARELVSSLSGPARDQAIFQTATLNQHIVRVNPGWTPIWHSQTLLHAPSQSALQSWGVYRLTIGAVAWQMPTSIRLSHRILSEVHPPISGGTASVCRGRARQFTLAAPSGPA